MVIKKLRGIELYRYIYNELITGRTQKDIIKKTGIDRGQLSRIVSKIETTGCLQCTYHGREKNYAATKKPFDFQKVRELYKVNTSKSQRLHRGCSILQIQNAKFKCKILGEIRKPPKNWDGIWSHNNLHHQKYIYPFKELNGEPITFIRDYSENMDLLKIQLPRIDWVVSDVEPKPYLLDIARKAAVWFQRTFKVALDIPGVESSGKIEYALVLRDLKLIKAAQKGNYKAGAVWIDTSSPHNVPEIESHKYDVMKVISSLEDYSNAYSDIKNLQTELFHFKKHFSNVSSRVSHLENGFLKMEGILVKVVDQQEKMMNILDAFTSQPSKPDSFMDVV